MNIQTLNERDRHEIYRTQSLYIYILAKCAHFIFIPPNPPTATPKLTPITSSDMSTQRATELRVIRALRDAHVETTRQVEVAHEQYDRAAIAHEAAERTVGEATRTLATAVAGIRDPSHPIVRRANRAWRHSMNTMRLALSSFQYAAARLTEMEEREAAARALIGTDVDPLVGI